MPPEAMAHPPQYDEKLDVFSFGHLALYVALQEFPCELLASVYPDPSNPNQACARNEVESRSRYVGSLRTSFRNGHTITKIIISCLHNHAQSRPSSVQVLSDLQKLQVEQKAILCRNFSWMTTWERTGSPIQRTSRVQSLLERIRVSNYNNIMI